MVGECDGDLAGRGVCVCVCECVCVVSDSFD